MFQHDEKICLMLYSDNCECRVEFLVGYTYNHLL